MCNLLHSNNIQGNQMLMSHSIITIIILKGSDTEMNWIEMKRNTLILSHKSRSQKGQTERETRKKLLIIRTRWTSFSFSSIYRQNWISSHAWCYCCCLLVWSGLDLHTKYTLIYIIADTHRLSLSFFPSFFLSQSRKVHVHKCCFRVNSSIRFIVNNTPKIGSETLLS